MLKRSQYNSSANNNFIRIDYFQASVMCLFVTLFSLLNAGCTTLDKTISPDSRLKNVRSSDSLHRDLHTPRASENIPLQEKADTKTSTAQDATNNSSEESPNSAHSLNERVDEVQIQILQSIAADLGKPKAELTIDKVTSRTWSSGCLNLARPDELCTMALVDGWQVQITHNQDVMTYHTDSTGATVRRVP